MDVTSSPKVVGDGESLAARDVRWYQARFVMQTSQGEFTVDVDASDGTSQAFDSAFHLIDTAAVDMEWIEPGCLQVMASIIGPVGEPSAVRTELTVRLEDGTDFGDDAIVEP